ncbi:MAG: hypothetical protein ACO2PO_17930, partial [Candidatus Calescibacterium sp.]
MRNKSYKKNFTTLIFRIILSGFALLLTFSFFTACGEKNRGNQSEIPKEIIKIIEDNLLPCSDELGKEYTGGQFSLIRNIKYSNSKPNLVGDLYLPYGIKNFPIAIHIHGGGWTAGN